MNADPKLKPDIAALKKRLSEDPGFAAQVTSDRPLTPGCRTPEGCSENGCLGWCDEHKPEVAPVGKCESPNGPVEAGPTVLR